MKERIDAVIDRVAATHSDRTAVISGAQRLTYGELRSWSDAIAADLIAAGVDTDSVVPLYAERGLAMIPALIGVMKAGAAYLPLDHRYPVERTARLAALATSPAHLIAGDVPVVVAPGSTPIFVGRDRVTSREATPARRGVRAYVVATSGSSGLPKPVITTQDNLSNFIAGFAEAIGFASDDVVLARTSLSFDPHTVETLLPLTIGARVVVLADEACADPDAIRAAVAEHGVTVVQATPSLWRALTSERWQPDRPLKALCGGEAMTSSLRDAILDIPGTRLWNVYGPTETTVWCSALEMTHEQPVDIGPPIAGLHFEARDGDGNRIDEVGQIGELYVAGLGLAEGYLGNPGLTGERFMRESRLAPFDRWYRTGDLVRLCSGGRMEFRGRADRQMKIRGYRVELDEVEGSVTSCPGVRTAAVVADVTQGTLVACVVSVQIGEDVMAVAKRVREHVRRELPPYLRPSRYVVLDAIPLTPTEKTDAATILSLARSNQATPTHASGEAEDEVVSAVSSIWTEILGTSDFDEHDRWEDVGGNSLSLIDLRARLARTTGVDVPVSLLTVNASVSAMARLVNDRSRSPHASVPDIQRISGPGDVHLAPSQLRFLAETPPAHANENALELLLHVQAPVPHVMTALRQIVDRHDVFRISSVDPVRRTQRFASHPISEVHDVTNLHTSDESFIKTARERRSRLAVTGPLSEWWVYGTKGSTYVHACLHHLVCDELSLHVLKVELSLLLAATDGVLPAASSLVEWVDHFGSEASRARFRDLLPTWRQMTSLSHIEPSMVAPARASGSVQHQEFTLPPAAMTDLTARARRRLLLAAAVYAIGDTLDLQNVGCRVVDSGRGLSDHLDDSFTIGWLAHHYPLSVKRGEDVNDTLMELDAVHEPLWERGQSYLWLRHVEDVAQLRTTVQLHALPLYFNYLPELHEHEGVRDVGHRLPDRPHSGSITGLALVARENGERARVSVWFDPQRLPSERVVAFERSFADAFAQLTRRSATATALSAKGRS